MFLYAIILTYLRRAPPPPPTLRVAPPPDWFLLPPKDEPPEYPRLLLPRLTLLNRELLLLLFIRLKALVFRYELVRVLLGRV